MIYIILNIFLAAFLFWFSFYVDSHASDQNGDMFINSLMTLTALSIVMILSILASFYAPEKLALLCKRLVLFLEAVFLVQLSFYFFVFPKQKKNKFATVIEWVLFVFAFYIIFFRITEITLGQNIKYSVESAKIFTTGEAQILPWTWYDLYCFLFRYTLPALSTVIMMLKCENSGDRLDFQRASLNGIGVLVLWLGLYLIGLAGEYVPMFVTLYLLAYTGLVFFEVKALDSVSIYDFHMFSSDMLSVLVQYIIPSVFVGFAYALLHPLYGYSPIIFAVAMAAVIIILLFVGDGLSKNVRKRQSFRSNQYELKFEKSLASIDYNEDPAQITETVFGIFHSNIECSTMKILTDNGAGMLETVFSSDKSKLSIPLSSPTLESLVNIGRTILFRSQIDKDHAYELIRDDLHKTFDKAHANALILLNEGHHIIGIMLLGPKENDNIYNDYDFEVFTRLYSYFFVYGYYLKNIGNKSVVGTVNREIRMSSQIISSIQENMDRVNNPKIDTGYVMVPAHNIGGEFVDLIRLNGTSHLFVIGNMSGKGISASMSMVILKSIIRTYLNETHDFKVLVEKINNFVRNSLPKGTLFEGVFGLLDFANDTMYYINCGIPVMFLYTRAYNNVIEIQGGGKILGFAKDISELIKVKKIRMRPGDIVLMCTDGIIRSHSLRGERFGKDRLQHLITENLMYPAQRMAQFADEALVKFMSKERENDVTVLVLKCLDTQKRSEEVPVDAEIASDAI